MCSQVYVLAAGAEKRGTSLSGGMFVEAGCPCNKPCIYSKELFLIVLFR